jgi:serine/threonine-protein kinase
MASTSADPSSESLQLLQRRVSLLGWWGFVMGGGFLAFRVVMVLSAGKAPHEVGHPGDWASHAAAAGILLLMWLVTRRGQRSARYVHAVETLGIVGAATAYCMMGAYLPLASQPQYVTYMALTPSLVLRAVFVPSSARRTLLFGVACAVPFLVLVYVRYQEFADLVSAWNGPVPPWANELVDAEPEALAMVGVVYMGAWWAVATAACTATSGVIYGLRRQVRQAMQLGQYTLEQKLGEGGMGAVYRASHAMLRRPTAVKLLHPERANEADLARFEREVQLTAQLTHPNTVTVFDYGRTPDGVFYYAMELLEGASLDEVVAADGAMPEARVVHVLTQVAGALAEAHGIDLIHRDIKPANILLTERGGTSDVAKVVDFGLVKQIKAPADAGLTAHGTIIGTPQYLSPEAIVDPETVDARSDLYSLGATAYYLLTGTDLFESKTVVELCSHHLQSEPEPPSKRLGRPVSPALERLLLDCLAKEPKDRPQSAEALRARLAEVVLEHPWTPADARRWWNEHAERIGSSRAGAHADPTISHLRQFSRAG